ncbi:MAG: glycosyltransferase [Chlorobi bacterium]|nr:glycosyltransferase [Chlorobiota bacterium]
MDNQIAVLLPHYNNLNGLQLTLKSLLQETEEFTLFIFDDGSDDIESIKSTIKNFSSQLKIILETNQTNKGITKTLNKGLEFILGLNQFSFIARLDAGDVCMNNRFKYQKEVFLENIDIGLLGCWVKFVDVNRKQLFVFKPPSSSSELETSIHSYNPFIHPSVMYRIDVINKLGFYPENYPALEDHAFFFKIIKSFKTSIVEHVLLEYEVNPKGISTLMRKTQTRSRIKLFLNEYKFGIYPTVGLLRALITHILPQKVLILFKKNFFYKQYEDYHPK